MEHARKMVLVPHEDIEKLNPPVNKNVEQLVTALSQQYLPSSQTPGTPITRADAELTNILNSDEGKDDSEKLKLYNEALRRFLFFVTKPVSIPEDPQTTSSGLEIEAILNGVPKTYRALATGLLNHIQRNDSGQRLKWDNQGRVTLDGNLIKGGHIVDLVNDALRHRKTKKSTGRKDFARFLYELNTPREFVGNSSFWEPSLLGAPSRALAVTSTPKRTTYESTLTTDDDTFVDATSPTYKKKKHSSNSSLIQWETLG